MKTDLEKFHEESARLQGIATDLLPILEGKKLEEARNIANVAGIPHRVTKNNGRGCMITHDLVPHRLNFEIEKDVIVKIDLG